MSAMLAATATVVPAAVAPQQPRAVNAAHLDVLLPTGDPAAPPTEHMERRQLAPACTTTCTAGTCKTPSKCQKCTTSCG
jgi:hypothetical protein